MAVGSRFLATPWRVARSICSFMPLSAPPLRGTHGTHPTTYMPSLHPEVERTSPNANFKRM